ncbi:hypothetical protein DFJ69_6105 [Thermomonospora umbrina]|uniref:Uncharacterized protein n=2 Tax=Thermomonospora umbrina TaxID=111806 RepID=A0A3D9T7A3_9ACTN|nr:hypothetical protein DFJ69_6105 [Thermomonospora umbrina]
MRKRLCVGLALATGVLGMNAVMAAPASAHATLTNIGSYGHGTVNSAHTRVAACDSRNDGRNVYVEFWASNGQQNFVEDRDPGPTCNSTTMPSGVVIRSYRVCVTPYGSFCTSRVTA